jgi:cell division protein FtsQ
VTSIDPRIAARRREVQEHRASGSLRRALWLLAMAAIIGIGVWVARSPLLSVESVVVRGVSSSSARSILAEAGVVAGIPLASVDAGAVERALLADPWIRAAVVARSWPDRVEVRIEERYPVAWVRRQDGWVWLAADGVALGSSAEPADGFPKVVGPAGEPVGEAVDRRLTAALAFVDALRPDIATGAVVVLDDELTAEVLGMVVRLGAPVDMEAKARVLAAILDGGLEPGSTVTLVAPSRPAVLPPGEEPVGEGGGEVVTEPESEDG